MIRLEIKEDFLNVVTKQLKSKILKIILNCISCQNIFLGNYHFPCKLPFVYLYQLLSNYLFVIKTLVLIS